ncbi:hypothetical protein [Deinococcus aquatilis]|uniref:hypothetical protein n=1 Tax=Deinococcus aquatilis TaxID=519440 RepID=UPI00037E050D|nr:hypothetical protein [Deinococcus aquatilis]
MPPKSLMALLVLGSCTSATAASFEEVPNHEQANRLPGVAYLSLLRTKPTYQNIDLQRQVDGEQRHTLFGITTITSFSKSVITATCVHGTYHQDKRTGQHFLDVTTYPARPLKSGDLLFKSTSGEIVGQHGPKIQAAGIGSVCNVGANGPGASTVRQPVRPGTFSYKNYPFQIVVGASGATAKPK